MVGKCFSYGYSKRLYGGDGRSGCKIGASIEMWCRMERPIVIRQEKDTFGT